MKKICLILAMIASITASAQKFMTRSGKVSFFSSTQMENIEAFNNEVSAVLDAASGSVVFIVPVKGFRFEKALMQEHFNENYMESNKFPKAEFKGKITGMSAADYSKDGTYKVQASGALKIHGVTKDVSTPGTIVIKNGTAMLNAKFVVAPKDYSIAIPSLTASKIASKIEVTIETLLKKS